LGVPRAKARAAALEAVRRALELDDSLAEAQATLGESLYYGNWDWVGAEKAFRRSLELNPNYATGHQWYSEFLSMAGRHDEAIAEMKVARALDPHAPILAATLGWAFYHARRYDEAIRECRATLGLYPDQGPARACLVTSLYDSGRRQEAFQEFMKVISLPGSTLSPQTLAAYQRGGWPAIWMHQWEQLRQLKAGGEDVSYYDQALLALRSDRPDDALDLLEKSLAEREESLVQLKAYAHFDPLLDHPRFQRLLVQVNFPPEVASSREGQN
jgi:tetratricopeptide (TPR) repeat protein